MQILIATDNSPHSEKALILAAGIVQRAGEPPTVLTVINKKNANSIDLARLQAQAGTIIGHLDTRFQVRTGNPGEQIVQEATAGRYDLVIMGRRPQRDILRRLFQSSTTLRVVEQSPCSVIVAQGKISPVRRILLCDSGAGYATEEPGPGQEPSSPGQNAQPPAHHPSQLGRFTAQFAAQIPGEEEITILHVMSQISAGPGVRGTQLRAGAAELIEEHSPEGDLLARDVQNLEQPTIHPNAKVRHGLVVDEILDEARSGDYDLVVIGAHRNHGWQRVLLDDLARRILAQLDRPVLVVR